MRDRVHGVVVLVSVVVWMLQNEQTLNNDIFSKERYNNKITAEKIRKSDFGN